MSQTFEALVVDDNPQDRFLVVRELRRQFPECRLVEIADQGQLDEAVAGGRFDLVITDFQLRWSDGLQVLRAVKSRYPDRPVIMFTATGNQEVAVEAMKEGLDDYIVKSPRHLVRLSSSVRLALERADSRRRADHLEVRLQTLLNRLNVGVFRATPEGRLRECNPALLRLLGVETLAEAQMLDLRDLCRPAEPPGGPESAGPPPGRERPIGRVDGQERWVAVSASTSAGPEDAGEVEGLVEDITDRKRLEGELQAKAEAMAEANRRKDEFLAILAHELRNPLAPIRNALQILEQANAPADVADLARQMMGRQIRNLTRLIDDLLDMSRIARGQVELRREPLDLAALVARTLEVVRPRLEERRLGLDLALPPHPVRVEADPVRLEQVFANLLDNAAKFTEPGGRVGLRVETAAGEAVVRVSDTGVGIPPEMLGRIFEPFTHVERSRSGASQWGLGIGLTLVRSLAVLHGGRVEAQSDGPGSGSEFVVRLPRLGEDPPTEPLAPAEDEPSPGAPLRILVVDDSRDAADSLAILLRLAGHDVRAAYDGHDALRIAGLFQPRLVLLDLGMPGMDGFEVARRLHRNAGPTRPVLVALTGWGQDEDLKRSNEAGFEHHLVKPVEPDALAKLVSLVAAGDP